MPHDPTGHVTNYYLFLCPESVVNPKQHIDIIKVIKLEAVAQKSNVITEYHRRNRRLRLLVLPNGTISNYRMHDIINHFNDTLR
jgi:hypothetical protein